MDALERIKQQVENNPVVIYMKGTPEAPRCGFSQRASQALAATGLPFAYVNVLEDPDWPTFPQIYIGSELMGGCDITLELYQSGELQKLMEDAGAKAEAPSA